MPEGAPQCQTCRKRSPLLTRGVCRSCYIHFRLAVARGETTWEELERSGLTLPAGKRGPQSPRVGSGEVRKGRAEVTMPAGSIGCLTCHERVACNRGCCYRCYKRHYACVRDGKTTWAALETAGLALPAKRPRKRRRK
jgi:hypothetical protein